MEVGARATESVNFFLPEKWDKGGIERNEGNERAQRGQGFQKRGEACALYRRGEGMKYTTKGGNRNQT